MGPIAPAVKRFYHGFLADVDGIGVWAGLALPILLHGLHLATKCHTLQVLGEATLVHWLCAGSVCRWLARLRLPVDRWNGTESAGLSVERRAGAVTHTVAFSGHGPRTVPDDGHRDEPAVGAQTYFRLGAPGIP